MFPPALIIYSFTDDAIVLFLCGGTFVCNGKPYHRRSSLGVEINFPSAFDLPRDNKGF